MTLELKENKLKKVKKKVEKIKNFYKHLIVFLIINLLFVISSNLLELNIQLFGDLKINNQWSFENPKHYPLWLIWGVFLIFHGLNTFIGPFFLNEKWEQKKIDEIMGKK